MKTTVNYLQSLLLLTALGCCAVSFALPTQVPPPPCPQVISGSVSSTVCNVMSATQRGELRASTRVVLENVRTTMNYVHSTVSSHPDYICLSGSQRGANTGLNPQVDTEDNVELGKAVNILHDCFYYALRNYSNTENKLKMEGNELEFAGRLNQATNNFVTLVSKLRNLTRSDERLSQGSGQCIIPATEACPEPDWATAGQVGAHQDRLRKLANFAISLKNYLTDLNTIPYWTSNSN